MADEQSPIGQVIAGRYLLLELLRRSGLVEIYLAEHKLLKSKLLITLLPAKLSKDQDAFTAYQDKLTRLADMESAHLARATDFGHGADGRLFVALEHNSAETLGTMLEAGPLNEDRAASLLAQVVDALGEAHSKGMPHGRLTPNEVLLGGRQGEPIAKLAGFGLTELLPGSAAGALEGGVGLYAAPELEDSKPSIAADIYALGAIAYQMVTGALPFSATETAAQRKQHREERPLSLVDKLPEISDAFSGAVDRALSKRSERRYPNATRFLEALTGRGPVQETQEERAARLRAHGAKKTSEYETTQHASDLAPTKAMEQKKAAVLGKTLKPGTTTKPMGAVASSSAKRGDGPAAPRPERTAAGDDAAKLEESNAQSKKTLIGTGITVADVQRELQRQASDPAATQAYTAPPAAAEYVEPPAHKARTVEVLGGDATTVDAVSAPMSTGGAASSSSEAVVAAEALSSGTLVPTSLDEEALRKSSKEMGATLDERQARSRGPTGPQEPAYHDDVDSFHGKEWFAEGEAAEQALVTATASQPLPGIYGSLDEMDLEPKRRISASMVIVGVIGAATVILFGIFFAVSGGEEKKPTTGGPVQLVTGSRPVPDSSNPVDQTATTKAPDTAPAPKRATPTKSATATKDTAKTPPKKAPPVKQPEIAAKPTPKPAPVVARKAAPPPKKPVPPKRATPVKRAAPVPSKRIVKAAAADQRKASALKARAKVKEGRAHLRRGSYTKARQSFSEARTLNPRNAAAAAGLGEVAFELGDYNGAARHLRSAQQLNPRSGRHAVMLGNVYFKQGKLRQAVVQYRRALRANPKNREARSGLEAAVRRLGRSG